jgi:hypothetical protein
MYATLSGRALLIGFSLAACLCCGCDVNHIASMVSGETKLSGPNAAIGGVNYVRSAGGTSQDWDRHITSCHLGSGASELLLGTDSSNTVLSVASNGDSSYAVLSGPDGSVRFEKKDCDIFKVKLSQQAGNVVSQDGSETLVCKNSQAEINSSVRFERCTH